MDNTKTTSSLPSIPTNQSGANATSRTNNEAQERTCFVLAEYVPGGHGTHCFGYIILPASGAYLPCEHPGLLCVLMHAVDPGLVVSHPSGQDLQDGLPISSLNVPLPRTKVTTVVK